MSAALAVFVFLDAVLLAAWAVLTALVGRRMGPGLIGGLVLLELTVLGQAGLRVLDGRPAVEPATHTGYLIASVVLLPLLAVVTRPSDRDPDRSPRWDLLVVAVACVALAVVDVRLVATGPPVAALSER